MRLRSAFLYRLEELKPFHFTESWSGWVGRVAITINGEGTGPVGGG
jgi:hypothetical protein